MVRALIERGELEDAQSLLACLGLTGDLIATWPHNLVRHARGCLHAAVGDHAAAAEDLLKAGDIAQQWGIPNPAILPWRSAAALSLPALGDKQTGPADAERLRSPVAGVLAARSASRDTRAPCGARRPAESCSPRRWARCGPHRRR